MSINTQHLRFLLVIVIAHTLSYLIAGGLAYQLITKPLWDSPDSILSLYLRTPGEPDLWKFAMIWQIPGQLVRSLLLGLALLPLHESMKTWSPGKVFLFIAGIFFIFTHFAAATPSPANIEGVVYVKPEFIKLGFVKMQAEMILYSVLMGLIVSRYLFPRKGE